MISDKKEDIYSLGYIRIIRLFLRTVGGWPGNALAGRKPTYYYNTFFLIEAIILICAELYFIYNRFQHLSFFILGNVFVTLSLTVVVIFRSALPWLSGYASIFRNFLEEFHLIHFKHKGEYSKEICDKVDRISKIFTLLTVALSTSGVVTFSLTPVYKNYSMGYFRADPPPNITVEFSIHYEYPFFKQEDHVLPSTLFNCWLAYACACMLTTMDLFLCLIVFQIIGHIKTLRHKLKSIKKPQKQKYTFGSRQRGSSDGNLMVETERNFDEQENTITERNIIECIQYHLFISDFTADISNFFGSLVGFNYMYHLFSLSILFVECMQGAESAMHYGPLTLMTVMQLMQLSVTFEIVGTESEKLKDDVYYVPWESMSVSNQRSVCLLLSRVQTPIAVTAMGMTSVGVQTMGSILKTVFSYCAFLRSLS